MVMKIKCSIPWFRVFMRLNGYGIVPTVTPKELMPSSAALALFWGTRSGIGFSFDDHGSLDYNEYVRELFKRSLQLKWPINSVLPFILRRR